MCGDPLAGHGPKRMHRILAQVPERYSRARVHERDDGSGNHAYVARAAVALGHDGAVNAAAQHQRCGHDHRRFQSGCVAEYDARRLPRTFERRAMTRRPPNPVRHIGHREAGG